MKDVSVLIPARSEMFLARTVEDLLEHSESDFEIIVVLDGQWANPPIAQHPKVNVIYVPKSVGQRAATNLAAKLSQAKYIVKCDAHCSFDQGWDKKMIKAFEDNGDNNIIVPIMKNLHVFDWKCYYCGWKKYQGPTPEKCGSCGKKGKMRRKMVWQPRRGINSTSYSFDSEPHFQYFEDWKHREPYLTQKRTGYTETMSLQGSFFMATKDKYWELKLSDEEVGNWGNQGIELAGKMWLSGGRVLCNHNTWYAHMFRTQGGDFGFPYPLPGKDVSRAKKAVWEYFFSDKFKQRKHPVSWLIERFSPVPGWSPEAIQVLKDREKELKMV